MARSELLAELLTVEKIYLLVMRTRIRACLVP
jgi:hypothetical protein